MSTHAQQLANQANAQHSSGPKTETGKAASAVNNRKHGFAGAFFLLPNEDEADYRELNNGFVTEYKPITLTEQILYKKWPSIIGSASAPTRCRTAALTSTNSIRPPTTRSTSSFATRPPMTAPSTSASNSLQS